MDKGYTDLHSHILYETDDGSGSLEETINMIKALADAGFSASCATPHNIPGNDNILLLSKSREKIRIIGETLEQQHIGYTINTGAENYFDASLEIKNPDYFIPLGNSETFLVEIPFIGETSHHIDALHKTGLHCIIAHVERYMDIVQNPDKATVLKQAGFLLQMNFGSLIGVYGADVMKAAHVLLKKGIVDVIATDIHDIHHAGPILKKGMKRLETLLSPVKVNQVLRDNPSGILNRGYATAASESKE